MKKIILVCMAAFFTMLPCISLTSGIEKIQPTTVQIEQKNASYFDNAESILVKRESKTTELEGTWKGVESRNIPYIKFYKSYFQMIEVVSENEYYEAKGTFRIKKDGSVTLLLSKLCRVVDGLTKDFFDLSEYKWITNLPDKFTYDNYSVDGEVLRLGGNTFVKCSEDIDWRIK